jgi:hypothetical protein
VAVVGEVGGGATGVVLSGEELWVGAGAGVELLHPLKNKVAERAKLAARYIDFTRIVFSGNSNPDFEVIYMDRLAFFGESCP